MAEILIAEDEKNVREGLEDLFSGSGYRVRSAKDGAAALDEFLVRRPDVVLLDVMMPKKDGFEVLAEIRRRDPLLPVILLTACDAQVDKIKGLGVGADDYVTKPFDVNELLARVSRALTRAAAVMASRPPAAADSATSAASDGNAAPQQENRRTFAFAGLAVDPARLAIVGPGRKPVPLTARELGILRLLARHPGEALGREHMLGTLWGVGFFGASRTLDQHIAQLRKKLGRLSVCIETVTGVGYRFRPELAPQPRRGR